MTCLAAEPERTQQKDPAQIVSSIEPIPLVAETAAAAEYPMEALGPLREVVEAVQRRTQAPMAIAASTALATASLAVHGHADVAALEGAVPTSLFFITVAESGQRKSAVDKCLMEPVRVAEEEGLEGHAAACEAALAAQPRWLAEMARIEAELAEAEDAASEDLLAMRAALGPEPVEPPLPYRLITDPTLAGLSDLLAGALPSLGLMSDEAGTFLGGHAMTRASRTEMLAALNGLWTSGKLSRTRAGKHVRLNGRRLALHLLVQPDLARKLLEDKEAADLGFLARALVSAPPSNAGTRFFEERPAREDALERWMAELRTILDRPLPMHPATRAVQPRTLPLAHEARSLLIAYYDRIEALQADGEALSGLRDHASRSAEQAARIAGVLTLMQNLDAPEVTTEIMADAIIIAQFHLAEILRLKHGARLCQAVEEAEHLRAWLLNRFEHDEVLLSDVQQRAPLRSLRPGPAARAALGLLVDHGWLIPLPECTFVRGAERKQAWRIVHPSEPEHDELV